MIITIDGPAASGKSSTARAVAKQLNFLYLDTGAMYRAVALAFLRHEEPVSAEGARRVLAALKMDVDYRQDGEMSIRLDDVDVTHRIRSEKVGEMASRVSALHSVRERMVAEQRRIAQQLGGRKGVVLEGRDTGTKVFPEADLKIYLVADVEERAGRRHKQLKQRGVDATYAHVLRDLKARDAQDMGRDISPLQKADGAVEVDTTHLTFQEQVRTIVDMVEQKT